MDFFFSSATTNVWGQEQHKYIFPQMIRPHIPLRTLAKEMKYLSISASARKRKQHLGLQDGLHILQ